jgi:hypothetical protein
MSTNFSQNPPLFLLDELNTEIVEIQRKLLEIQARLLETKQLIIKRDFQNSSIVVSSDSSDEIPIPF